MLFKLSSQFKENCWRKPSFDELMALEGEMYRQVARRKTFKFTVGAAEYFAKIHKGVGWPEIFKNLLQGRLPVLGAKNEYDAINALNTLGVKTMELAAFGQRGRNIAELESFVITESLEPAASLEDLSMNWAKEKPALQLKRALIEQVAVITKKLHDNGINHRDLYICHFLLKSSDQTRVEELSIAPPLYLIDLHRVQLRQKIPERWRVKDLAALFFSSMDIGFTQRDFYRFIEVYAGRGVKEELTENKARWKKVYLRGLKLKAKHS